MGLTDWLKVVDAKIIGQIQFLIPVVTFAVIWQTEQNELYFIATIISLIAGLFVLVNTMIMGLEATASKKVFKKQLLVFKAAVEKPGDGSKIIRYLSIPTTIAILVWAIAFLSSTYLAFQRYNRQIFFALFLLQLLIIFWNIFVGFFLRRIIKLGLSLTTLRKK